MGDLSVTQSHLPATGRPGMPITFTVIVHNAGPDTVLATLTITLAGSSTPTPASITFTQGACGGSAGSISCLLGAMTSGSDATITYTVTLANGAYTNDVLVAVTTATVGMDPNLSNNTTLTANYNVNNAADVSIMHSVPATVLEGQSLTDTITVSNGGSFDAATGVMFTDTLPAGSTFVSVTPSTGSATCSQANGTVSCTIGGIAVSGSMTITIVVTAPSTPGSVMHSASSTASSDDPTPGNNTTITASTNVLAVADLHVTKTGQASVFVGDNATFMIAVKNDGPADASGVTVTDTLPANIVGASTVTTPSQGTCLAAGNGTITCNLGKIANGASATITVVVVPTAAAGVAGSITNMVSATANEADLGPGTNMAMATTTVVPSVNVGITKTASVMSAHAGDMVVYTLMVDNAGPSRAANVTTSDVLPAGVTVTAMDPRCSGTTTITCMLNGLNAGATTSPTITVRVNNGASGTISNTATVATNTHDADSTNDSSTVSIQASPAADLAVTQTHLPASGLVNSNLVFTVTVTNNGPSTATAIVLTDTLPANTTFVSAPGCSRVGSTLTCNQATLASGATMVITVTVRPNPAAANTIVSNVASVDSAVFDPTAGNGMSTDPVRVNPLVNIGAMKTGPASINAGSNITYTVTVTNAGPNNASAVTATDVLSGLTTFVSVTPSQGTCTSGATMTCALGALASGASATITVVARAATAGSAPNTVTTSTPETDSDLGDNNATANTTIIALADLSLTKTGAPDPVNVGANLTYTFMVHNLGPSPATVVRVTDTLPANVSVQSSSVTCSGTPLVCDVGTVLSGATSTFTVVVHPITAAAGTTLTNSATVRGTENDPNMVNNAASATTRVNPLTDLSIFKASNPTATSVGSNITYTITASNSGPSPATGVIVTDVVPANVTLVSATANTGSCVTGATVTCTVGNLAVSGTATITLVVTAGTGSTGTLLNTATIRGNELDLVGGNNSSTASTAIGAAADVSIANTTTTPSVLIGANVTYNLVARNSGPSNATNVVVTDILPAGVSFVSATASAGSCSQAGGTVTCNLGPLANGAMATITLVTTPTQPGIVLDTATIAATEGDPNIPNNSQTATVSVGGSANLGVVLSDAPDPVNAGSMLVYTAAVHNSGPNAASGAALTVNLPAGVSFVSATATAGTCTQSGGIVTCDLGIVANGADVTATITVTPTAAGTATATATVHANETDTNPANDMSSTTTQVNAAADVALTITHSPTAVAIGSPVTYSIVIRNNGPVPATTVALSDPLPSGVTFTSVLTSQGTCRNTMGIVSCTIGTIPNGGMVTITIGVVPTATGALSNTASVTATETDTVPSNNSATDILTVGAAADVSLILTDGPDPVALGHTLNYLVAVTNEGPSAANGVVVTDILPSSVTFVSATASQGSCTLAGSTLTCTIGGMARGGMATILITVIPTAEGTISDQASLTSAGNDPNSSNDMATVGTTVVLMISDDAGLDGGRDGGDGGTVDGGDGSVTAGDSAVGDGGKQPGAPGGCGCRTSEGQSAPLGAFVLGALGCLVLVRRRRR